MASSFAGVMPGLSRTRGRWTSVGALTTTMTSHRRQLPPSSSSGTSSTAMCAPERPRRRCTPLGLATSGCTIASRRLKPAGSFIRMRTASRGRRGRRRGAGKRSLDRRHGLALVELVHQRVGVADRDAALAKLRCAVGLAHADGAGEADDEHKCCSFPVSSITRGSARTGPSGGIARAARARASRPNGVG